MHSGVLPQFRGTRRFQLRRRVGQGAVGVVYEAWDQELNIRVALKTLRAVAPETLLSLKKDFRAVQDIRHPNLVKTGELFEEDGTWFFTMEFVDGVPLRHYVRPGEASRLSMLPQEAPTQALAEPRFNEARLRAVLPQLVHALLALHARGKVHRDVKPSNILVTDAGRAVLLDFGVAFDLIGDREDSDDGSLVGTVAYMAPEQAVGEAIGASADWYSVGTILYECLTGRLPFYGQLQELVASKMRGAPPHPAQLVLNPPSDLSALCMALLRVSPAERPTGRDVLSRLGEEAEEPPVSGAMPSAVFVGRHEELRVLEQAFTDVRGGATVTVLIHGESGVGKSFLVRRFLSNVSADEAALVLAGRCFERESVPYKAVDGIIDQLRKYLASLTVSELADALPRSAPLLVRAFPVLGDVIERRETSELETSNPQALRARTFEALRDLLVRVSRARELVLSIDDLQWADKDSLELIAEITRPPEAPRMLLLATVRMTTEQGSGSARGREALEVVGDVRSVQVHQLARDEAQALARALLGTGGDESAVDEIVSDSKGHPLFLDELARQHSLARGPTRVLRLDDALWSRVERLQPQVQRLLEMVSISGIPISLALAAEAVGVEPGELTELVDHLRSEQLAKTSGSRRDDVVEVYHDRVRQSVLAHLGAADQSRWHGRLAAALERIGSKDAETLSVHWHGAGNPKRAAMYAERAADVAVQTLAFERAARLYRSALQMEDADPATSRSLEERLASALLNAGYVAEAAEVNLSLADRAKGEDAIDLKRRAAEQLLCSGRFEPGLVLLRSVLDAVGTYFPENPAMVLLSMVFYRLVLAVRGLTMRSTSAPSSPSAVVRADVAWSAGSGFAMTDHVRGAYFQSRNLVQCLHLGDRARVTRALAMEVCFRSSGGRRAEAQTALLLAKLRAFASDQGDAEASAMVDAAEGYHHFMVGRWAPAADALGKSEVTFRDRCVGVTFQLNSVRTMLYRALGSLGRYNELGARVPSVLRDVEKQADQFGIANVRSGPMVVLGLRDNESDRVRDEIDEANARLPRDTFLIQHYYALLAECQLDFYRRDGAAALGRLQSAWPALRRSLLLRVQTVRVLILEARVRASLTAASSRTSARRELLEGAERGIRSLESEGLPWSDAVAGMLRAGLGMASGADGDSPRLLEEAESRFDALRMNLYAAACRLRRGELVQGTGGRALIDEANARFIAEGVRRPDRMVGLMLPGRRAS